jgi:hypothetical protein
MGSRPSPSRVGWSIVILAAAVAVATNLWLTRAVPLSEKTPSGDTPPGVEGLPKAGPVADHSPVIRPACDRAGNGTQSSDGPSVFNPNGSTRSATTRHRNDAGSYEFLAPRTWKLRKQGSISTLVGPGRDFVVSLAPGPVGGLPRAYDEFVELVGKTYGDVKLGKIDIGCAAGDLSVWLYGKGTNAAAAPFEFLAVMIERSSGRTVGAFGAWNPKTPQVRPLVRQVMKSFHAIPVRA